MVANNSNYEKALEELTKKIERETANQNRLREGIVKSSNKLEDLKRKKLEVAKKVEEEEKFEKEKKDLIATAKEEGKIDDFLDFHKETKDKVKDLIENGDWKKIKKTIEDKDREVLKLQEKLDKLEKEHDKDSEDLEKAIDAVKDETGNLVEAFDEIKKLPLEIKVLKQQLVRYKKLIEIAGNKEEPLKMAFYLNEMEKTIKEIDDLAKSKDQIAKRLDRKGLKDAQKHRDEAKKECDKSFEKYKAQRDLVEKEKKAREGDILKEIKE